MTTATYISLLAGFFVGTIAGLFFGILYESTYGPTRGKADEYREMVLRMITALNKHYTKEFVYWELIRGERRSDP